jgi:hypothetical protein
VFSTTLDLAVSCLSHLAMQCVVTDAYFSQDRSFVAVIDPALATGDAPVVETFCRARGVVEFCNIAEEGGVPGCEAETAPRNGPAVVLIEGHSVVQPVRPKSGLLAVTARDTASAERPGVIVK